jgi:hypothetical protein
MPCDPGCPELVAQLDRLWSDPLTAYSGVGDEIGDDIERRHLAECERCQTFGAANVEAC